MSRLPPMPPDWAVAWGQDGFGLYADMAVGAAVQRRGRPQRARQSSAPLSPASPATRA
jgi:hypothetical protein